MKHFFSGKEVPLPNSFCVKELFNPNRGNDFSDVDFVKYCFEQELIHVRKHQIGFVAIEEEYGIAQRREIHALKKRFNENDLMIERLWNVIQTIKKSGLEVLTGRDLSISDVRAYIPGWKLMMSLVTQSATNLLHLLAQNNQEICIVTHEYSDPENDKLIVYIVDRKSQFYEEYANFARERERKKNEENAVLLKGIFAVKTLIVNFRTL